MSDKDADNKAEEAPTTDTTDTTEESTNSEFTLEAKDFRFVFCRACGSEMRAGQSVICSDCLDDEVDRFYKAAMTFKSE
jgi:hypothetical protein